MKKKYMSAEITTDQWFEKWMELYKRRTVKNGTVDTYKALYKSQIKPAVGSCPLSALEQEQLQSLLNSQFDRGYSANTLQLTRAILSSLLGKAAACRLIEENPAENLIIPRFTEKTGAKAKALTREESALLLEYCQGSPIENLVKFALCTGMRGGEICALRWEDIDCEARQIHIRHTLKSAKGVRCYLDTPKTTSSLRDIPLTDSVLSLLPEVPSGSLADFVFTISGDPIIKGQLQSELAKIKQSMAEAGHMVPEFTFHSLRHTFATRCIEAGMKPKVLQKILGHSSLAITMDTYVTVQEDEKAREMEKLEGLFF